MRCVLRATPSTRSCPGLTLNPQLEVEKAEVGQGSEVNGQKVVPAKRVDCDSTSPIVSATAWRFAALSDFFACTDVHRTDPESEKTDLKRSIATHGGTLIEKMSLTEANTLS
jgi:hypothetical protein